MLFFVNLLIINYFRGEELSSRKRKPVSTEIFLKLVNEYVISQKNFGFRILRIRIKYINRGIRISLEKKLYIQAFILERFYTDKQYDKRSCTQININIICVLRVYRQQHRKLCLFRLQVPYLVINSIPIVYYMIKV